MPRLSLVLIMLMPLLLAACAAGNRTPIAAVPDAQFGHRYEGTAPDGRTTMPLATADARRQWLYFPAPLDSVQARYAPFSETQNEVPVEVLFKGAFPDRCMEFARAEQHRTGNIITIDLVARRAQGALCAAAIRPFRFYLPLEGTYAPGQYTLRVNGLAHPFEIRRPESR